MFNFFLVFLLLFLQLFFINLYANFGPFDFTNLWPLVQTVIQSINFISLIFVFEKMYKNEGDISFIDFLIRIGLAQAILSFAMVISPSFKEVANLLYTQGTPLPSFISNITNERIYGIGSDYTVMLPFIQALLAVLSTHLFFRMLEQKYILYSLILISSSFLNNRTGFYIYLVVFFIYIVHFLIGKLSLKKILIFFTILMSIISGLLITITLFPDRFETLFDGVKDLIALFLGGASTDEDLIALTSTHVVFPTGINLLIGTGHKIYGRFGIALFGYGSDIGYINDIFKGGIIYMVILYFTIFRYIYKYLNDRFLSIIIIIFLLIANYKATVLSASPMLSIVLALTFYEFDNRIKLMN